ncbi:MAG: polysaccharide deacetylase family protein [Thomasclavelia sp.]
MKKMTLRGKITIIATLLVVVLIGVVCYFIFRDPIVFKTKEVEVEINESFDPLKNIETVRKGDIKDVKVDSSKVKYDKLGEYDLIYTLDDQKYTVTVKVVDTTKPKFDVVDLDIDLGMKVDPASMVTNIKDATKTKASFKEDYDFSKEGTVDVVVCLTDQGDNVTEKKGKVKIVKDKQAPEISDLSEISVIVGGKVDYNQGVTVSDNRDPEPKLEIDSSKVDLTKVGTYKVTYTVTDRSGNKTVKKREIKVVENKTIGTSEQSSEKIVYLTFDDGPSANTQKILDILDQYNAKATFFVTGNNQSYNHLIKTAHDKGHTIALHTYCHDYPTVYSSVSAYFDDLNKVGNMVKDLIGYFPRYVRFPGGGSNTVSRKYCPGIMTTLSKELIARGYQYYDWNVDSQDASGNNVAVSKIISSATSGKSNNLNILFHDTAAKSTTVQALPAIIEYYQKLGYRFEGINDSSYAPHQKVNN